MKTQETKFIVKPEDGIVVGIKEVDVGVLIDKVLAQIDFWGRCAYEDLKTKGTFNVRTFKAIARCSKDDKFDEEFGKKLVEARIWVKVHEAVMRELESVIENADRLVEVLWAGYELHGAKVEGIEDDMYDYFFSDEAED